MAKQPYKCPCCDGWGQRWPNCTVSTTLQMVDCPACLGTGLIWAEDDQVGMAAVVLENIEESEE